MRLLYGGYGFHPSGKQYVYWGDNSNRTGQNLNVPVTHYKSGKLYNTMFTVMRTSDEDSPMAQNEAERLDKQGINIKHINGTNVMTLPGARDFSSKTAWKEESNERYWRETRVRIESATPNQEQNDESAAARIINYYADESDRPQKKYEALGANVDKGRYFQSHSFMNRQNRGFSADRLRQQEQARKSFFEKQNARERILRSLMK